MKKTYHLILLLLTFQFSFSQFYIVKDEDGFVNVREENSLHSKIIAKLNNGEIVHSYEDSFENKGHWLGIDFDFTKNEFKTGYVYRDRLISIDQYERIPMVKKGNEIVLKNKNIEIRITEKKFQKRNHTFIFHQEYKDIITKIDYQDYYGTDGYLPKTEYSAIEVTMSGKTISLPKEALKNLFEPNSFITTAHYDQENDILYIDSLNSDGAGSYEVLWVIEKGKFKKRLIFSGC